MLRSLRIENFRCFQSFELQQLGRLNLLVGTNNSGKTSILEAVHLLTQQHSLAALQEVTTNRGEYVSNTESRTERELDIRHLFYGHEIKVGTRFSIFGDDDSHEMGLVVSIGHSGQLTLFEPLQEFVLLVEWLGQDEERIELPLSVQECLPLDYIQRSRRDLNTRKGFVSPRTKTQIVRLSSLTTSKMIDLFDSVVLTPEEDLITRTLQTIEPNIERIASVASDRYKNSSHSGFVVRFSNTEQRVPIGNMGDGIWRLLGITLALVSAKDGVLLVDEIDTGLHFSVMSDMWKLIWETAKRLNVQVFATTHNSDCWMSLSAIANTEHPSEEGITIQRIEKNKPHSVVFTERQVAIAAERGIEVR
jgi:predicted ATP-dependent endonuclease of OLD family